MAEKKRFLLRIDPEVHRALEKWAADDLRSVNAQIEFLLKEALARAGRVREAAREGVASRDDEATRDEEASGDA